MSPERLSNGETAFRLGAHIGDCPHAHGSDEGRAWRTNFIEAQSLTEQENGGYARRHAEARAVLAAEAEPEGARRLRSLLAEIDGYEYPADVPIRRIGFLFQSVPMAFHIPSGLVTTIKELQAFMEEAHRASAAMAHAWATTHQRTPGELFCTKCRTAGWSQAEWRGRQHPTLIRTRARGKVLTHTDGAGKGINVYHFERMVAV